MNYFEKNRLYFTSFIFLGLTLPLAYILNIRQDEAYSLQTTSAGLAYSFKQAIYFELQPPAYFVLLSLWRFVSSSIFWARLFSVISIFISILLFDQLLKDKIKNRLLPLLFFTLNPVTIWAALEIRVYAFSILWATAYLFYFTKYYQESYSKTKYRLINISLILVGLFTYYYSGFLIAGVFMYILLLNRKMLKNYFVDLILPALFLISIAGFVYSHIEGHSILNVPTQFSAINLFKYWVIEFFDIFITPIFNLEAGTYVNIALRLVFIFLLSIIIYLNKEKISAFFNNIHFIVSIVMVVFFTLANFVLGAIYATHPHAALIQTPLLLAFITVLGVNKKQKLTNALLLFLLGVGMFSLYNNYKRLYKQYDVKTLATYVDSLPKEEPVFIYTNESYEVLKYYVKNNRNFYPIPKKIEFIKFDIECWIILDEAVLDSIVKIRLKDFESEDFVYISDNRQFIYNSPINHQKLVREYFKRNFTVIDSTRIESFSIYKLKK